MKKVLFVHTKNDYTGSTRVLANVIQEDYRDFDVTVIALGNDGLLSGIQNAKFISICNPLINGKRIPYVSYIISAIHRIILVSYYGLNSQIIYVNTILPYYAAIIARIYRKELIYHIHEYFLNKTFRIFIAEFVFDNLKARRIYVSEYLKSRYNHSSHCVDEIRRNRLSEDFLKSIKVKPFEERKKNTILMVTSLSKAKGIDMFFSLAKEMSNYNFILVISASLQQIYDNFPNIPANLKILPTQANLHPIIYNSDLLLNLTNPNLAIETFGMTILEVMPYGIPAIVPNVGGPIELIVDGYNGYCVDVCDKNKIKNAINKVFSHDNYTIMCKNCLEHYDKLYAKK